MAEQVSVTRRTSRQARELAELEALATNESATALQRARAATQLARARGHMPRHLVQIRRAAMAALEATGMAQAEIARQVGLAPYAGRVCQILRAHREASHGTA